MIILLTRHGQTEYNRLHFIQGMRDIPLNDVGKQQAYELMESLKNEQVDLIISSPLARANETAEIVSAGLHINKITDHRLAERAFGQLEGKEYEMLDWSETDHTWDFMKDAYSEFGVEDIDNVVMRTSDFLEDLKKREEEHILIISHGAIGKILQKLIYKNEPEKVSLIGNCDIVKLEL